MQDDITLTGVKLMSFKDSAILARPDCIDSVALVAKCSCSENKQKAVRHFRKCCDQLH